MEWVVCWLVLHSSSDALDNREYIQVRGYVMRDAGDKLVVNFFDDFKAKSVNVSFNEVVQTVDGNECKYNAK
jgi:hypothetical protein